MAPLATRVSGSRIVNGVGPAAGLAGPAGAGGGLFRAAGQPDGAGPARLGQEHCGLGRVAPHGDTLNMSALLMMNRLINPVRIASNNADTLVGCLLPRHAICLRGPAVDDGQHHPGGRHQAVPR